MVIRKKLILNGDTEFRDAVQLLDETGDGVIPVVDESDKLLGIITDGDVRRSILKNDMTLEAIINKSPISVNDDISHEEAVKYLKKLQLRHLPVVSKEGFLRDIVTIDANDFQSYINPVVIMAGGYGSRLGSLTKDCPKPMLMAGNKPILQRIIESFAERGFCNIYISVYYKSEVIKDYFQDGRKFGVKIRYLDEKKKLGTAGALKLLGQDIKSSFFVMNGDILTTLDFENLLKFHESNNSLATMCVREYTHNVPFGVVDIDNNEIKNLREKPTHRHFINTGIYAFNPGILDLIPDDEEYNMDALFNTAIEKKIKTCAYETNDSWVDIGHIEDYRAIHDAFSFSFDS